MGETSSTVAETESRGTNLADVILPRGRCFKEKFRGETEGVH